MKPNFDQAQLQAVGELLKIPAKVVITTHHKPDGDAMGSSLALYQYLKNSGHDVQVIAPSDYPDFLYWLPGNEQVINYDHAGGRAKHRWSAVRALYLPTGLHPGTIRCCMPMRTAMVLAAARVGVVAA